MHSPAGTSGILALGLVAMFRHCYNALTVWPTGNRSPLVSAALALEKTLPRNSRIFIKRRVMPWWPSSWQSSLRRLAKIAKRPSGIPPPPSAFVAPTGKPRPRKLLFALAETFRLRSLSRNPTNCSHHPKLLLLPNPACHLNKPPSRLKRLSPLQARHPDARSPSSRSGAAHAAAVVVAAAIAASLALPPGSLRCRLHRL